MVNTRGAAIALPPIVRTQEEMPMARTSTESAEGIGTIGGKYRW